MPEILYSSSELKELENTALVRDTWTTLLNLLYHHNSGQVAEKGRMGGWTAQHKALSNKREDTYIKIK